MRDDTRTSSPGGPADDLFDIQALADYLGISKRACYSARHRQDFPPAFRVGRELRWRREDVTEWIASRVESEER